MRRPNQKAFGVYASEVSAFKNGCSPAASRIYATLLEETAEIELIKSTPRVNLPLLIGRIVTDAGTELLYRLLRGKYPDKGKERVP